MDTGFKLLVGGACALLLRYCELPDRVENIDQALKRETSERRLADSLSITDRYEIRQSIESNTRVLQRIERQTCAGLSPREQYQQDCPGATRP